MERIWRNLCKKIFPSIWSLLMNPNLPRQSVTLPSITWGGVCTIHCTLYTVQCTLYSSKIAAQVVGTCTPGLTSKGLIAWASSWEGKDILSAVHNFSFGDQHLYILIFQVTTTVVALPGKGLVAAQRLLAWICSLSPEVQSELDATVNNHGCHLWCHWSSAVYRVYKIQLLE